MLKIAGAVMIVASSSALGFSQAVRLKRRAEELGRLVSAMAHLENEISYGKGDIKSIVSSIGSLQKLSLFIRAAENMKTAGTKDAFLMALETDSEYLLGTDKKIIAGLAQNLGMTDTQTQVKSIRHTKGLLEVQRSEAEEEYMRSGRLFKSTGVLAGLGAVILLF